MNKSIKLDLTEIQRLRDFLDENSIGYEVKDWGKSSSGFWEGYNLHVINGDIRYSFLLSKGSYGREKGLIEFYNFNEEPTGYLTADECMKIIKRESKSKEAK